MCLLIAKPRNRKRTRAYKVVQQNMQPSYVVAAPPYKLNEPYHATGDLDKPPLPIFGGAIHVFTTLRAARREASRWSERLIEVSVDPADWIADGTDSDACYKTVTPTKILNP